MGCPRQMVEPPTANVRTVRLTQGDTELARRLFSLMAEVFGERSEPLGDRYLEQLLTRTEFWAIGASSATSSWAAYRPTSFR